MSETGQASIELVVEGNEKKVVGFIRGLFIGARIPDWPIFHDELGIQDETLAEQLKGWVGLTEPLTHLVVTQPGLELVRSALADPRCHGITLRSAKHIESASFGFRAKVFTEEAAESVRNIFEKVPAGVHVTGWDPKEVRRGKDAEGVELYSPVHHYKLEGHGRVEGPFRQVLYVHEQARRIEQIEDEELALALGADA